MTQPFFVTHDADEAAKRDAIANRVDIINNATIDALSKRRGSMTNQEMEDATKGLSFDGSPDKILVSAQTVLTKAIKKAIAGGWKAEPLGGYVVWLEASEKRKGEIVHNIINQGSKVASSSLPVYIYNHDFAKALWGEDIVTGLDKDEPLPLELDDMLRLQLPAWQFYLRQMVIADDPIKYLGENI